MSTPRFSILHPTRRLPEGWKESCERWASNARCINPFNPRETHIEYLVCVDEADWGKIGPGIPESFPFSSLFRLRIVRNDGRPSSTTAYNAAAKHSTGDILICNADDVFPPQDWDLKIDRALLKGTPAEIDPLTRDFILHPSTGNARDREVIFQPFMSRARYNRLGYFFYEGYNAMYADDDLSEHARQDGAIIPAFQIVLEHRHPALGKGEMDETYAWENRPENYELGAKLIVERRARRFQS